MIRLIVPYIEGDGLQTVEEVLSCGDDDTSLYGTGSAIFSVQWPDNLQNESRVSQALNNPSIDCNAWSVATVDVEVRDSNNELLTSAIFQCSEGAGTVTGIPVGTNRVFIVTAKTDAGGILYQGSIPGMEILKNVVYGDHIQ